MEDKEHIDHCPFCGSDGNEPYLSQYNSDDLMTIFAVVACDCGVKGPERYGDYGREEAIEAWNKRVPAETVEPGANRERVLELALEEIMREALILVNHVPAVDNIGRIAGKALSAAPDQVPGDEQMNQDYVVLPRPVVKDDTAIIQYFADITIPTTDASLRDQVITIELLDDKDYVPVPVEPTDRMSYAGHVINPQDFKSNSLYVEAVYKAMLEAARGCQHEWVNADNEVVSGAELCIKCNAVHARKPYGGEDES